jgi:hypothetical protein
VEETELKQEDSRDSGTLYTGKNVTYLECMRWREMDDEEGKGKICESQNVFRITEDKENGRHNKDRKSAK